MARGVAPYRVEVGGGDPIHQKKAVTMMKAAKISVGILATALMLSGLAFTAAEAQSQQDAAPQMSAAPAQVPAETPAPASASPADGATPGQAASQANSQAPGDPVAVPDGDPAVTDAASATGTAGAETDVAEALLPHDLSPWGMFMNADMVVKVVMLGLAFASVITWTVFLAKAAELLMVRRRTQAAFAVLAEARSLMAASDQLGSARGPGIALLGAVKAELRLSADASPESLKERIASRLERVEAATTRMMTRGTGVLATIGSTAPFVGLFGTVWGIMNSFIGISKAQTTNLAVVAPGIAEALLATAIGLVAAIPAVVIYNLFARLIAANKAIVADTAAAVLRLVSRELDRDAVPYAKAAE